ncbi:MAG: hypothetical protein MI921_09455 [Cytophagales bacterium]|nr:hypothetical protein [Cytophagales bacterium]
MKAVILLTLAVLPGCFNVVAQPTRFGTNSGTGGNNTNAYFGYEAGKISTGEGNTFIGRDAGLFNTTGYSNNFLGYNAGENNTTGYQNVFVGRAAGYDNTSGYFNVFLGSYAGRGNTIGFRNSFLGYRSGNANIDGRDNVFIGFEAGGGNTTGDANVYIGNQTGAKNTEGIKNVFVGRWAGENNVIGNANLFLGYTAGRNETGSNKLYIANDDLAIPLIYGDFSTEQVGINMKPPAEFKFGVTGNMYSTGNLRIDGGMISSPAEDLQFQTAGLSRITVSNADGNVGIGGNPTAAYKLAVEGHIGAREVNVTNSAWPDYVFTETYHLPTLIELEQFIKENHHLPNIPSAHEVNENGIDLGSMNGLLLEKIEQLMLYTIAQQKEIEEKENKVKALEKRLEQIEKHLSDLNK